MFYIFNIYTTHPNIIPFKGVVSITPSVGIQLLLELTFTEYKTILSGLCLKCYCVYCTLEFTKIVIGSQVSMIWSNDTG